MKTRYCYTCNKEIENGVKICPHCNTKNGIDFELIFLIVFLSIGIISGIVTVTINAMHNSNPEHTLSPVYDTVEFEAYKEQCMDIDIDSLRNDIEGNNLKKVKISTQVFQIFDESTITMNDGTKIITATMKYFSDTNSLFIARIEVPAGYELLEYDRIIIYGYCNGTNYYINSKGMKITHPAINVQYYELDN